MSVAIPILAGLIVFGAHVAWHLLSPATSAPGWGPVAPSLSESLRSYSSCGAPWLGASYALSSAFTAHAALAFRESRRKAAAGAAGGLAVMGTLYAAGCFALGCCGSPMLPLYIGFLGGTWADLGGPLLFGLTLLSVGIGFVILRRRGPCACDGPSRGDGIGQG